MSHHQDNDLSVIAIDSGSDKSFDFLGAAKVMTALKELIIDLWDKVVFYRERKLYERIELISKTLPLIDNINQLEKDEKLSKEQAELFRRGVLTGAKDFLLSGAILPEFESHSTYNPRQIMAPETKLLTMPTTIKDETSNLVTENEDIEEQKQEEHSDLSSNERELLKSLLEREAKRKRK
ncbi:hypothetical protein [Spirosoma areae]